MKLILLHIVLFISLNLSSQTDSLDNSMGSSLDTLRVIELSDSSFNFSYSSPQKGLIYAQKAINLARAINYRSGEADAYNSLGVNEWVKGNYNSALENYYKAKDICETINNKQILVYVESNIALVLRELGSVQEAIIHREHAIKINKELNNEARSIFLYITLGGDYFYLKNYSKALSCYAKAMSLTDKKKDFRYISEIQHNRALIYIEKGDYKEALNLAHAALATNESIDEAVNVCSISNTVAKIYLNTEKYNKFDYFIHKAIDIAKSKDYKSQLYDSYDLLSSYFIKQKDYREALIYIKSKDSIKKVLDENKLSANINIQKEKTYRLKKEKQISLLEKDNEIQKLKLLKQEKQRYVLITFSFLCFLFLLSLSYGFFIKKRNNNELKRQNKLINDQKDLLNKSMIELKESNLQKDKFISIIAHDLRNPFNVILGFSNMLKEDYDILDDDSKKGYIDTISNSSRYTYNLLEDLLLWARSNNNINLKYETKVLNSFIEKTLNTSRAQALVKDISIINNVELNVSMKLDSFTMSCIIGNIVSNAIKFTNNGGHIVISYNSDSINHYIFIEDNGVGMTKEKIDGLFSIDKNYSTEGTSHEKGSGLGMLLCYEFVAKYNGSIKVDSELDKGSTFCISIPIF